MRKEVKKIRVLSIRKLTRHLAKLKSKKGTQEDLIRNQRRAQRLLEEIHAMKFQKDVCSVLDRDNATLKLKLLVADLLEIKPDDVTKTALQTDINFEKVCKMNGSSAEERAIARLATHPQFKKRIDDIKAAVKAFKEERLNPSTAQSSEKCHSEEEEEKSVQNLKVEVAVTDVVGGKQKDNKTKQKPINRKKKKSNVHLTPLPKENISNQSEEEKTLIALKGNGVIDSNLIVHFPPKEDLPSSPQENISAAATIDSSAAPAKNIPDASTEDGSTNLGDNVSSASFKSMTAIPTQDLPAIAKDDLPSFVEGKDIAKEGVVFLTKEDMAGSSVDRLAVISEEVSQKQKDKLHARQTKKESISQKRRPFSVQNKLDKSKAMDSDSSDMEESDKEDRVYFDDSTEERFLRQSSGPDDSDSEDDFFLGKVKQTKKRKRTNPHTTVKGGDLEFSKISEKAPLPTDSKDVSSGTQKPNPKLQKLESVFCQSLSQSKPKGTLTKRNIKVQPQREKKTEFQRNKQHVMKHQLCNEVTVKPDEKKQQLHTAKQDNKKHKFHNVKQESKTQHHQQPLHPSWEASKKRKEQQSLITAFQGKKIRFDD